MRETEYLDYLHDIMDSIMEIEDFVEGANLEKFSQDRKTINAVIRSLEVIGEATKRIPDKIRNKFTKVPWKKMAAMRDKLIHEYSGVDIEIVWKVATEEIPALKPLIEKIIDEEE